MKSISDCIVSCAPTPWRNSGKQFMNKINSRGLRTEPRSASLVATSWGYVRPSRKNVTPRQRNLKTFACVALERLRIQCGICCVECSGAILPRKSSKMKLFFFGFSFQFSSKNLSEFPLKVCYINALSLVKAFSDQICFDRSLRRRIRSRSCLTGTIFWKWISCPDHIFFLNALHFRLPFSFLSSITFRKAILSFSSHSEVNSNLG